MERLRLSRDLTMQRYKKGYTIKGRTRKYMEVLKAMGGVWNRYIYAWMFDESKKDLLISVFIDKRYARKKMIEPSCFLHSFIFLIVYSFILLGLYFYACSSRAELAQPNKLSLELM